MGIIHFRCCSRLTPLPLRTLRSKAILNISRGLRLRPVWKRPLRLLHGDGRRKAIEFLTFVRYIEAVRFRPALSAHLPVGIGRLVAKDLGANLARTNHLSPRQRETLRWVKTFIRQNGMPPTVREIGGAFDIKSSSVFDLLKALERKGCLYRNRGARSLVIHGEKPRRESGSAVAEVPVVGRIPAGQPIEAIEHQYRTLPVSKDLLRGHDAYALKVEGQSMVEVGILDGDYVIVRKQETADDGDIVVALIGDEATLKRLYRENDGVRLEPANRNMVPVRVRSGEFGIQGKVVAVQRAL